MRKNKVNNSEARKAKRELSNKLKKADIDVEIQNISIFQCKYTNPTTKYIYFDLEPNQIGTISLEDLYEVTHKAPGFFRDHDLIISYVYSDEFDLDDILMYLGIYDIYENIDNKDENYIENLIYESDMSEFKEALDNDARLCRAVAQAMLVEYKTNEYHDSQKLNYIYGKLDIKSVFEE